MLQLDVNITWSDMLLQGTQFSMSAQSNWKYTVYAGDNLSVLQLCADIISTYSMLYL